MDNRANNSNFVAPKFEMNYALDKLIMNFAYYINDMNEAVKNHASKETGINIDDKNLTHDERELYHSEHKACIKLAEKQLSLTLNAIIDKLKQEDDLETIEKALQTLLNNLNTTVELTKQSYQKLLQVLLAHKHGITALTTINPKDKKNWLERYRNNIAYDPDPQILALLELRYELHTMQQLGEKCACQEMKKLAEELTKIIPNLEIDKGQEFSDNKKFYDKLNKEMQDLKKDPNLSKVDKASAATICKNILLCIVGLGIFYAAAVAVNYARNGKTLFWHEKKSEKHHENIAKQLDDITKKPTQ